MLDFILQVVIVDQVKGKLAAKMVGRGHCLTVKEQGGPEPIAKHIVCVNLDDGKNAKTLFSQR